MPTLFTPDQEARIRAIFREELDQTGIPERVLPWSKERTMAHHNWLIATARERGEPEEAIQKLIQDRDLVLQRFYSAGT